MENKNYFIPDDLEEALSLKAEGGVGAAYLAGGTYLNWGPVSADFTTLIDLKKVLGTGVSKKEETLCLGARMTLQETADHPDIPEILRKAAAFVASRQIRNMATLGGNIAAARPDSNIIPALLTLGAELEFAGGGRLSLAKYLQENETSWSNDIITEVIIPDAPSKGEIEKVVRSTNAYPVLIAAVTLKPEPVIVVNGAFPAILRLGQTEAALIDDPSLDKDTIEALVHKEVPAVEDIHGSVEYKKYIAAVTVSDLVQRCRDKEV